MSPMIETVQRYRGCGTESDETAAFRPVFEQGKFCVVEFLPAWRQYIGRQIILLPLMGAATAGFSITATLVAWQDNVAPAALMALLAFICGYVCAGAWAEVSMAFRRERYNTHQAVWLLSQCSKGGSNRAAGERGTSPAAGGRSA